MNGVLRQGANVCVFAFFALSLCVPSGYSWGSAALALLALLTLPRWRNRVQLRGELAWLVAVFLAMACIWGASFETVSWVSHNDLFLKYLLASLALLYAASLGVDARAALAGMATGAAGAVLVALYQVDVLRLDRANGFTNAIQFGGIALYMGFSCWVAAVLLRGRCRAWVLCLLAVCGTLGLVASMLSQTRGAWVAIPMILLLAGGVLYRAQGGKMLLQASLGAVILAAVVFALGYEKIESRIHLAVQETQQYFDAGKAATSVGQRWDHWKLAWEMGIDSPWTGWGEKGYQIEKQKRVDRGQAAPTTAAYGHAHNEILDMFARRGLIGLSVLLAFYIVPFAVFWRQLRWGRDADPVRNCLACLGMMLPVCYFAFGTTQVFFAHNSGHLFYLFTTISLFSACRR